MPNPRKSYIMLEIPTSDTLTGRDRRAAARTGASVVGQFENDTIAKTDHAR
jgi:hypothetical protein